MDLFFLLLQGLLRSLLLSSGDSLCLEGERQGEEIRMETLRYMEKDREAEGRQRVKGEMEKLSREIKRDGDGERD